MRDSNAGIGERPLLECRDLGVTLEGRVILRGLNFTLRAGECLAIVGPNGAGKTVLLRALMGQVPHAGEIHWADTVRPGYVPQKMTVDRLLPLTPRDLLAAKARVLRLAAGHLEAALQIAALPADLEQRPIGLLSGGQLQKLLLAFALLGDPPVLLVDEPTASLDELAEEQIYERLERLGRERNLAVVLISHDLSVVYRYAENVLCLNRTAPCFGPTRQVLSPAQLEELYGRPLAYYEHRPRPSRP